MSKEEFLRAGKNINLDSLAIEIAAIAGDASVALQIEKGLKRLHVEENPAPCILVFSGLNEASMDMAAAVMARGLRGGSIKLDMEQYRGVSGYLVLAGYDFEYSLDTRTSPLNGIRTSPLSLVHISSVEKGDPRSLSIVNDLLISGRTTSNGGNDLDFTKSIIVITTALDRMELKNVLQKAGTYSRHFQSASVGDALEKILPQPIQFGPFSEKVIKNEIATQIKAISENLRVKDGKTLSITEEALNEMASHVNDRVQAIGVRAIRNYIARTVVDGIIDQGLDKLPAHTVIDYKDTHFVFKNVPPRSEATPFFTLTPPSPG